MKVEVVPIRPCETYGHSYHTNNYIFARDVSGKPFRGGTEWHGAAKFTILICGKCGEAIERQVGPVLEDRTKQITRSEKANLRGTQFPAAAPATKER